MKVSKAYRVAHGLTPDRIADTMIAWYRRIDEMSDTIVAQLKARGLELACRAGCCGCCRDDLSMTQAEAAVIRKLFPDIGLEKPHPVGSCPFLDENGLCRIYAARPYICRTHGLPMQIIFTRDDARDFGIETDKEVVEVRDICANSAEIVDVMAIPASACWNGKTAELQLATMEMCTFQEDVRVPMRDFFQNEY